MRNREEKEDTRVCLLGEIHVVVKAAAERKVLHPSLSIEQSFDFVLIFFCEVC